jgi:hypothetical protein
LAAAARRQGQILEVAYIARLKWANPLYAELQKRPDLAKRLKKSHRLLDLGFAIDTRLMFLPDLTQQANESLEQVVGDFSNASPSIAEHLAKGIAITVHDRRALNRALINTTSFIAECRACFENLAEFYREFAQLFLGQSISKLASYKAVAEMARRRGWASKLQSVRHDLLHYRSLWLAFEIHLERQQMYEPLFMLNWRPGSYRPKDTITMRQLNEIRSRLVEAAYGLRKKLMRRLLQLPR